MGAIDFRAWTKGERVERRCLDNDNRSCGTEPTANGRVRATPGSSRYIPRIRYLLIELAAMISQGGVDGKSFRLGASIFQRFTSRPFCSQDHRCSSRYPHCANVPRDIISPERDSLVDFV